MDGSVNKAIHENQEDNITHITSVILNLNPLNLSPGMERGAGSFRTKTGRQTAM